ncbi:hypothetical protein [Actinomadura opuntiae]|uniref:hypothetical protein n=1 Tax=Actinomadura sp. OS1-43 TaxID=604315 RepID=UPI00255AB56B|nr:hypothetical protein [Actinomadura sp. OS1-43]MDL4819104.1 hypothetical protein [Actinomadura sp. OS1-43]
MSLLHPGEGVLRVYDAPYIRDEALGFEGILWPASRELLELADSPDHLTTRPEPAVALRVETVKHRANDREFVDRVSICFDLEVQIGCYGLGHASAAEEVQDVELGAHQARDGVDEEAEQLGRVVEWIIGHV